MVKVFFSWALEPFINSMYLTSNQFKCCFIANFHVLLNQIMREKVPLLFLLETHYNELYEEVSSFGLLTDIQLLQNCKYKSL